MQRAEVPENPPLPVQQGNLRLARNLPEIMSRTRTALPEKWDELFMTFGHNDG
jgi:hypothetical protein